MVNKNNFENILKELEPYHAKLVAVSKSKPVKMINQLYGFGQKIFGENYVQELKEKFHQLPEIIEWHFIGHLQTNKVKFIAPFVSLIHSVDSMKLLREINKEAIKNNRTTDCLLQVHIAEEETKTGLSFTECEMILKSGQLVDLENICIKGLMGMATLTNDSRLVRKEFKSLRLFFEQAKTNFEFLSMGMSADYKIALEEGSNLVRIGSAIFGDRI